MVTLISSYSIDALIAHGFFNMKPKPRDGKVQLAVVAQADKELQFTLSSAAGKQVWQQKLQATKGNTLHSLNLKQQAAFVLGTYYLQVIGVEGEKVKKVMVK